MARQIERDLAKCLSSEWHSVNTEGGGVRGGGRRHIRTYGLCLERRPSLRVIGCGSDGGGGRGVMVANEVCGVVCVG